METNIDTHKPLRSKPRFSHTAYAVAFARIDPAGEFQPQVFAVRIFSESAQSLTYIGGSKRVAFDVGQVRDDSYQEASDRMAYMLQNFAPYAWTKPLLDGVPYIGKVMLVGSLKTVKREVVAIKECLQKVTHIEFPERIDDFLAAKGDLYFSQTRAERAQHLFAERGLLTKIQIVVEKPAVRREKAKTS